jgi:hypothetical protein
MKVYENSSSTNFGQYTGIFQNGKFFKDLNHGGKEYDNLVKVIKSVPQMPKRLGITPIPKIDPVVKKIGQTQESLAHIRQKFLTVDQKCEELGISFDNVFQILFKLFVNINDKLKKTHYKDLDYFISAVPSIDPKVERNKHQSIQIEDYGAAHAPKDNIFEKHIKAFDKNPKNTPQVTRQRSSAGLGNTMNQFDQKSDPH